MIQLNIVDESLHPCILGLLKFSILSLYRRIFSSSRWFYILTWIVTALLVELALQVVISTNLQCSPIAYAWDQSIKGSCIDYGAEALSAYVINITTDPMILIVPIPLVLKLGISEQKKGGGLLTVFAVGGR